MSTHIYDVPTISCDHCKATIERGVAAVAGVTDVTVDVTARQATVIGSAEVDAVVAAIVDAGYAVASIDGATDPR